jgi:hypothetical protein
MSVEPARPRSRASSSGTRVIRQYLDRVFERADLYLYYIVDELERRDMPAELPSYRSSRARSTRSPTPTAARPALAVHSGHR